MQRISILLFVTLVISIAGKAQEKPPPTILVISAAKVSCDPGLKREADSTGKFMRKKMRDEINNFKVPENLSANDKRIIESGKRFVRKIDIFKMASLMTDENLHRFLYQRFDSLLILLEDTTISNSQSALMQLARSHGVTYIVNFPEVGFYKENGEASIRLKVQLYDFSHDSLLFEKEYTGNQFTIKTEFNCEEQTLTCLINNCTIQVASDMFEALSMTHPVLKKQKQQRDRGNELKEQRTQLLITKYFKRPWDGSLAKSVIDPKDSDINTDDMFYSLQNEEKTRFVALFVRRLNEKEKKDNAKLYPSATDTIAQFPLLDTGPDAYAYIVRGMNYNGKWYYEPYQSYYFNANTLDEGRLYFFKDLQRWNFFTDDDTSFNSNFWETGLFAKIADLRKDPDWERKKKSWQSQERSNRDYIGMYEIVANKLKLEEEESRSKFAKEIFKKFLQPLTNSNDKINVKPVREYEDEKNDILLFFPKDRRIAISPVKVIDNKGITSLLYYVIMPASHEMYEWTRFSYVMKKDEYAPTVMLKHISSLINWDFSYDTLDDDEFWNKHVLLKENGNYKYLKAVQKP